MKRYCAFAAFLVFATAAVSVAPAQAQGPVTAAEVAAPIVVHVLAPKKISTPSTPGSWMKAEVLHADANSIVVSEQGNERVMHTFTYNDSVKTRMRKIVDNGGYQYGDKIKIKYTPGTTVALKIHGKPTKAS
jgi:hypothetical protein